MKQIGTDELIDYELLVHNALRRVVHNVLDQASFTGLPGNHHFYVCFSTTHPLVQLPDYLYEEYPEDMTIVLQHEYLDLVVTDTDFSVTLCFDETHERIVIPFDAIISFVDPSVKFGLQFNPVYPNEDYEEPTLSKKENVESGDMQEKDSQDSDNVVTIDFSKRK